MILILINFLFNGYQLVWIYAFCLALLGYWVKLPNLNDKMLLIAGFGSITLLMLISLTSIAPWLIRLFLAPRLMLGQEKNRIEPLLIEVLAKINHDTKLAKVNFPIHVRIIDNHEANSKALGKNTIILTSGILATATDEELKGVLAHEVGHLYFKHSLFFLVLLCISLPNSLFLWLYFKYNKVSLTLYRVLPLNAVWQAILFLAFLPILILEWIGTWLFKLCLLMLSQQFEYQADKFAAKLGYKAGLIAFLEKAQVISQAPKNLFALMLATHPSPIKRIGKLEHLGE